MKTTAPHFLVVGPQRTGTSWLYDYLKRSRQIRLPKFKKELDYFDDNYDRGPDWYRHQFDDQIAPTAASADVSTKYFSSTLAAANAKKELPNAKIVVMYRNPADRLISLYNHMKVAEHRKYSDLYTALKNDPWLIETSLYGKNTDMWASQFGQENVIVIDQTVQSIESLKYRKEINRIFNISKFKGDDSDAVINAGLTGSSAIFGKFSNLIIPAMRNLLGDKLVLEIKESAPGKFATENFLGRKKTRRIKTEINTHSEAIEYFMSKINEDHGYFLGKYLATNTGSGQQALSPE